MRQNPHVRICGGPGSATTLVYPTLSCHRFRDPRRRLPWPATGHPGPAGTDQAADVAAATTGESDDAASSGRTAGSLSCDAASVVRIGLTTYNVHNLISFDTATDSR